MEIQAKIDELSDNVAIKLLNTIAEPHTKNGVEELLDDQANTLAKDLSIEPDRARMTDGEMARTALHVLARLPAHQSQVDQLIDAPDIRAFPSGTPMEDLENETLVWALREAVDFERDEDGSMHARPTEASVDKQLLKQYSTGVLVRLPAGPLSK
jgi:hypothetical protein